MSVPFWGQKWHPSANYPSFLNEVVSFSRGVASEIMSLKSKLLKCPVPYLPGRVQDLGRAGLFIS